MWCPSCKYRFLTKQTKCTHCGANLKEEPDELPKQGYRYLLTCRDDFELQLKRGLLASCQIAAVRGYMPEGTEFEIYTDRDGFGNDLFVAIDQYEDANEIIREQAES